MIASATTDNSVKPTTHGFLRRRESESAPKNGIEITTRIDATAFATALVVFDAPRSLTSHTVKYNDAMFIEKMVFAKSYSAQLNRSNAGARSTGRISPFGRITGGACWGWAMRQGSDREVYPRAAVDGDYRWSKLRRMKL